ncbi:efflux transporter outer membrane subunit [Actomonas aquatica]|uniref:Efflux transporter outer membrane subunit n=1 Tax=Actomonas aquatica TaxID=2866162 RepID=A0ABZ1C2M3_9BACT|nr:efflux transporter outer membrane subunit [Opitutus sp. WL0086]WRQ85963.1 efflux transporter outer membrane subunit [Opitutus sp. WL0086]
MTPPLCSLSPVLLALASVAFVAGCTVGPTAERPTLPTPPPEAFVNAPAPAPEPTPSAPAMTRWWTQIDDPAFAGLVDTLLAANLNLQQATERVTQARERLNATRGGNLAALSAGADARRAFTTNAAGDRVYTETYAADLNVSWTLDLFGSRRRAIEAGTATFLSAAAEQEALSHALIAQLLNRRVAIAVNQRLLELARENASNRELLQDLVSRRYELGASGATASDVYLAAENVSTVQADVPLYQRQLAAELYQLDVLLGRTPGTTAPTPRDFPLLTPPAAPAPPVPAALLDRRPDLRASELRARAATANVGIALADLYPQLTLGGSIGVAGPELDDLFSTDQLVGSLLGSITQRLFAGGALRANLRLQESAARELAAAYANDVLDALREVETALQADRELDRQLAAQTRSLEALRAAERLAAERYRSGLQPLQSYLDTQQRRYRTEQAWLLTQQARWTARVNLHLALGGTWFDPEP